MSQQTSTPLSYIYIYIFFKSEEQKGAASQYVELEYTMYTFFFSLARLFICFLLIMIFMLCSVSQYGLAAKLKCLNPSVQCGDDQMTPTVNRIKAPHFLVDRGKLSSIIQDLNLCT